MHTVPASIPSDDVASLPDAELLATLRQLLTEERTLSARLLLHLAEVDARGLYREQAYASMFDYCVHALHLSESEAYLRIRAARLARQFPRVQQMLSSGELHLSAIKLLAPVLTEANADALLAEARHKSKREVELLLAQHFEKPDVSTSIRALPDKRPHAQQVPEPYVSADGKRCEQRGFLELHHEHPFGRGGPATPDNIRVLCRSHNQLLAERDYGGAFMRARVARAQSERR